MDLPLAASDFADFGYIFVIRIIQSKMAGGKKTHNAPARQPDRFDRRLTRLSTHHHAKPISKFFSCAKFYAIDCILLRYSGQSII
jgi:hypothetical protein